jgi:hypothetical protein
MTPRGLVGFYDMKRFLAATFSVAFVQLETLQGEALADVDNSELWHQKATNALAEMAISCKDAGFDRLAARCTRLAAWQKGIPLIIACHLLRDLLPDIQGEMMRHAYFIVPENRKNWYRDDDTPLFGEAIASAIPNSTVEIAEAGRCYALERWTACVFHLMRAVELALHKWSGDLGLVLKTSAEQANMQDILTAADLKLKAIGQQPKSIERDANLEYFGDTSAHFRAIKDAWRNHVAHAKRTYDERETTAILNNVHSFLEKLATR